MPGDRPATGAARGWGLGALGLLLAAVGGLAWLGHSSSQAEALSQAPHVAAVFKDQKNLQIAVALVSEQKRLTGVLQVELLDQAGQILDTGKVAIRQEEPVASYGLNLAHAKAKEMAQALRLRLGNQQFDLPLSKVLVAKGHETSLSAGQEYYTGSPSTLRCVVQGVRSLTDNLPLPGTDVIVRLRDKDGKAQNLYQGKTDRDGKANVHFEMPVVEAGQYALEVVTKSPLGEEKLDRQIRIKSEAKILLVTDKPIYQPGQLMHIRALALRPFDLKPVANKDLLFEVEDSKGNKVFKKTFKTSEFGIASVDFQLADEVNMGDYHLRAFLGDTRTEKTVNVKRYVLPKFKVEVTADKAFYLPKETIKATLQSDYFFGKPVSNAKIEVTANTFDVQFRQFHKWTGKTDANGHAKFEIQLPDYFVGQPLQKGNALVKLDVKVLDSADHSETVVKSYTVSDQPIRVSLIPEGGKIVPNMENRIFAAAIYPDGSPAACEVQLFLGKGIQGAPVAPVAPRGRPIAPRLPGGAQPAPAQKEAQWDKIATVKTNAAGLAEFRLTPKAEQFRQGDFGQRDIEFLGGKQVGWGPAILLDVRAEAQDAKGNKAQTVAHLNSHPMGENVLLRLDKAIYQTGDSLNIDVRTSAGMPTVFVDIIRGGQVFLSKWLEVKDAQAAHKLDLPQNIFGSVEIHAYQMLNSGEIIRDSRVVYVQPRNDLKIEAKADKTEHLPGENGRIRFQVTDSQGKPTPAALGIIIVDEAVYALQDLQPGLEKVYFTLQEELTKPQVQIEYRPRETLDNLIRVPALPAPQQQIAEVLLTAAKLPAPPARWDVNPAFERRQRVQGQVSIVGGQIFNYAWNNPKTAIEYDKAAQRWVFKASLFEDMLKAGHLQPQWLEGPFTGKLTVDDLAKLNKDFSPSHLGQAITHQRMINLFWGIVNYTNGQRAQYFKDGKWVFPGDLLARVAKAQNLQANFLQDAWGQPIRLVKSTKKIDHKLGHNQFDYYELVSSGPDRFFRSKDDIRMVSEIELHGFGWVGNVWWLDGEARKNFAQAHFGRPGRGLFREEMRFRALGEGRAGGFGGAPGMPMPAAMPMERLERAADAMAGAGPKGGGQGKGDAGGGAPITRIREFFPETMLWQPSLITDDKGIADLAVNFADSITTWRLSASANAKGGMLGGANIPLKVFQDFFVDIDLPVSLTQTDEVAFPVAVYNYLKTPQTLKLELQQEPWFELLDAGGLTRSLDLQPNEVTAIKFRIRANKIGYQPLTVKAYGSKKSDAVKRVVEVVPNGQRIEKVVSDRLSGKVSQVIDIPQTAIPDASKLIVRIYPGVMAQVMEGVEGLIRLPGG